MVLGYLCGLLKRKDAFPASTSPGQDAETTLELELKSERERLFLEKKGFQYSEPYVVNNFPTSYPLHVHPDAQNLLHAGEIDIAIHSLTRDKAKEVVAVEKNPTTAALGLWKKEAIRQLSNLDYAALVNHLLKYSEHDVYALSQVTTPICGLRKLEETYPDSYRIYARIKEDIPPWARIQLEKSFEPERIRNSQNSCTDRGTIHHLMYLEPEAYSKIRGRLDLLDIQVGDVFDMQPHKADLIGTNNIFDYVKGDITDKFCNLSKSLNGEGRLVVASTKLSQSNQVPATYVENGETVILHDYHNLPSNGVIPLAEYLKRHDLVLSNDPIFIGDIARPAPTIFLYLEHNPAYVEVYRKSSSFHRV